MQRRLGNLHISHIAQTKVREQQVLARGAQEGERVCGENLPEERRRVQLRCSLHFLLWKLQPTSDTKRLFRRCFSDISASRLFHLSALACQPTQPKRNIQYKRSADGVQLPFVVSLGCCLCLCLPTRALLWHNRKTGSPYHSSSSEIQDMCAIMIHSFSLTSFSSSFSNAALQTMISTLGADHYQ